VEQKRRSRKNRLICRIFGGDKTARGMILSRVARKVKKGEKTH
jgi:hypothetical protein